MDGDYYVYVLKRSDGSPFYVGKGKGDRINMHEWKAKRGDVSHRSRIIRKEWSLGRTIQKEKIAIRLSHDQAVSLEKNLIEKFGRRNKGGPLVNLTDGGEGTPGHRHSKDTRKKMSEKRKNRPPSSQETRMKMRESSIGKKVSESTKKRISESISGDKHWNWGKSISDVHAKKLRSSRYRPVIVGNIRYQSIKSASEATGIRAGTIYYQAFCAKTRRRRGPSISSCD